jgi:hypothetical protein
MAQYTIDITVSAIKEQPPAPMPEIELNIKPGSDPVEAQAALLRMAGQMMAPRPVPYLTRPAGVTVTKQIALRVESFAEIAEILGRFESLAESVECNHPAA